MAGIRPNYALICRLRHLRLADPESLRDRDSVRGLLAVVALAIPWRAAHREGPRRNPDIGQPILGIDSSGSSLPGDLRQRRTQEHTSNEYHRHGRSHSDYEAHTRLLLSCSRSDTPYPAHPHTRFPN